ncbi:GNAT family N-acetyltransferase [Rhizohabitans arisaemae]|uniref:GNAT family N-acetyltransferase n=1 Tax=Rhizohabitans arisaemae TaxID=2720610 RepID=UPI0024B1004C|nr:GNAT family N-acetyltransferase [Rhizohabitans arisaemae]
MAINRQVRPVFPPELRLTGAGLVLREWTDADLPEMVALFDEPEIARWTPLRSPFDLGAAEEYLVKARRSRVLDLRIQLAITTDGGRPKGEVLLIAQAPGDALCSIGYTIGAIHRGQRLAARAVRVLTDYAHLTLNLPRVTLEIEAENTASNAVARAAGYHLTDHPPIPGLAKGRPYTLHTWAHDHPRP